MKKCTVIINPTSGRGLNDKLSDKISKVLNDNDYIPNIIITEYKGHAEEVMNTLDDDDLVISVGGDGTFNEVMNGNLNRKNRLLLSHIPVGTTNDIGHMYGLTSDIISNLKLILKGKIKTIDICTINNRGFVYVAGFGKFMDIPYDTPQELKHRFGYFAYMLSAVKQLFQKIRRYDITYEVNGERHRGRYTFLILSNANRIAGIDNFYQNVKLDDNKFEIMFCSLYRITDIARAFYIMKTSDITRVAGIELYKTDNLKIIFNDKKNPWCIDGEKFDSDTNTYEIKIHKDIRIMMPLKNISKLFVKGD